MIATHPIPNQGSYSVYDKALIRAHARGVLVPAWVPMRLIAEFVDCALEYGEEHAARHVRKVKKELGL